jgi:CHAD domain-containing protein
MSPAPKRQRLHPLITQREVTHGPLKWQAIALARDTSANDAFSATGNALLAQLRAHESGALLGHNPEYLHQMRVTVRRLRALLSLYSRMPGKRARQQADNELRWLAHALGPARDSDVFVNDIWPPVRQALGNGLLVKTLNAQWLAQRRRNARVARRALASGRYQDMMRQLEFRFLNHSWRDALKNRELAAWDQRARGFARQELEHRAQRVRVYGRVLQVLDADTLHRLRIEIKKLRYVMDAVAPLFKRARVKKMLESLSALQDMLGAINDVAVAAQKTGCAFAQGRRIDIAQLQARFSAWQTLRLKVLKRKLNIAWRAYRHAKPFW